MAEYKFSAVIEKDSDGCFAHCPELQGCYSQGKTFEAALKNIKDAIKLHVDERLEAGEKIPQPEMTSLARIELTA